MSKSVLIKLEATANDPDRPRCTPVFNKATEATMNRNPCEDIKEISRELKKDKSVVSRAESKDLGMNPVQPLKYKD